MTNILQHISSLAKEFQSIFIAVIALIVGYPKIREAFLVLFSDIKFILFRGSIYVSFELNPPVSKVRHSCECVNRVSGSLGIVVELFNKKRNDVKVQSYGLYTKYGNPLYEKNSVGTVKSNDSYFYYDAVGCAKHSVFNDVVDLSDIFYKIKLVDGTVIKEKVRRKQKNSLFKAIRTYSSIDVVQ